ncbi:MAG: hypothetical protein ACP5JG_14435, partial [Anaerolineae bacterium]
RNSRRSHETGRRRTLRVDDERRCAPPNLKRPPTPTTPQVQHIIAEPTPTLRVRVVPACATRVHPTRPIAAAPLGSTTSGGAPPHLKITPPRPTFYHQGAISPN